MKRGVAALDADALCGRLAEVGLLDDTAYAEMVVRGQREQRGLVGTALRQELRRRGVPDDDAALALAATGGDADEAAARRFADRRAASLRRLPVEVGLRRLAGALARRGHPPERALRIARESLAGAASDEREPHDDGRLTAT